MTTETTKHVIIHTHGSNGDEICEIFRDPLTNKMWSEDLAEVKEGAAALNKKHKPHKFGAYTLVKR